MSNTTLNPSTARKKFYQLLKVNENHTEIEIISERNENNAVLIGFRRLASNQRNRLILEQIGTLDIVKKRVQDDTGIYKCRTILIGMTFDGEL